MIYEILPVNNYQGNNSTTTFEFDFYIENENQLNVFLFDGSTKTKLKVNVDYSINELKNKNGSYITFPVEGSNYGILSEEQKISLELTLPISQETQYNNSSLLNLQALEYSLDYLTRLIQILARKIALCIKVEECSSNTPDGLLDSINEANQNANAKALEAQNQAALALERLNAIIEQAALISQDKLEVSELVASQLPLVNMFSSCILSAPNPFITYSGSTVTVKAGLRVLIPDGFNTDGTLKNIDLTLENDLTRIESGDYTTPVYLGINSNGGLVAFDNYIFSEEAPTKNYTLWYKPSENKTYLIQNETATLTPVAVIGKYGRSGGLITNVYPLNTVNLALKEELDGGWTAKALTLVNNMTIPVGNKTYNYDLSSYLPDDGENYEVVFSSRGRSGATAQSGSYLELSLKANWTTTLYTCQSWVANNGQTASGQAFAIVGADRNVTLLTTVTNQGAASLAYLGVIGYRKVR